MPNEATSPATVVILPTLWSGPWVWRRQRDVLAAVAPVVEIPDAVVNWPIAPTLEAAEAHVLEQIAPLPKPLLLVGASVGGLLALRIAILRPALTAAVVASGCPGLMRTPSLGLRAKFTLNFQEACEARAVLFQDVSCVDDELLRATVAAVAHRSAARRAAGLVRALNRYDPANLHGLRVPGLLIWGENDRLSPIDPWRTLASECAALHLIAIAGAGHVPMLEAPEAFERALSVGLAALSRPSLAGSGERN